MRYADVIVDISLEKLDKTYQYAIPDRLQGEAFIGAKANVPFGKGNRRITGYILDITDQPVYDTDKIKEIDSIVSGAITLERRAIALAARMRERFGGTMNEALKTVLPVRQSVREVKTQTVFAAADVKTLRQSLALFEKKGYTAKVKLFTALLADADNHAALAISEDVILSHGLLMSQLKKDLNISKSTIDSLVADGLVTVKEETSYRNPAISAMVSGKPSLNEEQRYAVEQVYESMEAKRGESFLLFGVTGSGKTEVYLELIERVIQSGGQTIVLIPEIALTFQTVKRFTERFGDRVSVLHSRLSQGERFDQFQRAKNNEIDVMIGPRSALFTPFEKLSLIVIDEEQETAYKSEGTPKYHAREMAEYLRELCGATLLLGSATPSLEAYERAQRGEYRLLTLKRRAKEAVLPSVEIVDLRKELTEGNRSIFSRTLSEHMTETLAKGEQIMLFLNRRGYAGAVSCRLCGTVMKCPHCDVSLTYHRGGRLRCHYCGYETSQPKSCPSCSSPYIGLFGTGTEKVEEAVHRSFPEATVLRMDADTTKNKGGHERIVAAFARGEAQILIGTQMIVKGHDFKNVTLVGILAADLSLFTGDFRAAERTFQLLAQAAGRAGRGEKPGHVVIQTYQPEHYSITNAVGEQYEAFYEKEMAYRRLMSYPPVGHMLAILITADQDTLAEKVAKHLVTVIRQGMSKVEAQATVIGPAPAGISKINDRYRYSIYLKSDSYERLTELCNTAAEEKRKLLPELSIKIQFDFDPYQGY